MPKPRNKVARKLRWLMVNRRVSKRKCDQLQVSLEEEADVDATYLVLIVGSCAIATFGLLSDSAAVIIGAMIIAPLMLPIRCLAFGALEGESSAIKKGAIALTLGTGIAILMAYLLGEIVGIADYGDEVWARSRPNLLDLGVAITAGGISGFAKVQPKISSALAGTAIAVALMPPICVVGLGLAASDWQLSQGAVILYLTNLLGITLSCMVAFLVTGYTPLFRARRGLAAAALATSILLIPLGLSFFRLVLQSQLENSLRTALLDRTITFQRVELVALETNWLTQPPQARLLVVTGTPLTPKQVRLLEEFVALELNHPFELIFEVTQVNEVRREPILPGGGR
ncbi:MAG: DUF389 domain-containing protein [Leptolyngbyaceae bacterium]|nr:DUF389 domain-containing protein [Leptolyngbyaceae bacterium]